MPDGRGARFALEAAFLVAVAAVLAFTDLRPLGIVAVMLVAWAIVALLEWLAWRERPHWASGSPPRYYVPQQPLPPRPPSVELPAFHSYPAPAPREADAPTWIATPELRAEVFGWPVAEDEPEPAAEEEPVRAEPQTTVEELPDELLAEAAAPRPEPEPEAPREQPPPGRLARHRIDPFAEADARRRPWTRRAVESPVAELPPLPRHVRIVSREDSGEDGR